MSEIDLASAIDRLVAAGDAYVTEVEDRVTVSQLNLGATKELLASIKQAGLAATVYDGENTEWTEAELTDAYAPYRLTFAKNSNAHDTLFILTNSAFAKFLAEENSTPIWRIARIGVTIFTEGRTYADWKEKADAPIEIKKKSPRSLVREANGNRIVPQSIAPWTLTDATFVPKTDAAILWANASIAACLRSLADDIDSETTELKFKGPPRLSLQLQAQSNKYYEELGSSAFSALQQATAWVFENEREAEVRHILLACEVARSSGSGDSSLSAFGKHLLVAFEGAKIAYQMSIAEVGKDTLKSLADLRKSVTEDTSKVTESTRQVVSAVTSALALGFGLIAARLSTSTPHWLLVTVMGIVVLYVVAIVYSGYDFICLQRTLRLQWKDRLYRFLPQSEYESMVAKPISHAERTFKFTAWFGGIAVALLTVAITSDFYALADKDQKTKSCANGATKNECGTGTGTPVPKEPPPAAQHPIAPAVPPASAAVSAGPTTVSTDKEKSELKH